MTHVAKIGALILSLILSTQLGFAQSANPYAVAVRVNDGVITNYEITQRVRMLQTFGTAGDLQAIVTKQLIDERLRQQAARALGVTVSPDELLQGMESFAARGNLSAEQLLQFLGQRGVDRQTFTSFVATSFLWRNVVRAKFGSKVTITDNDVDTALSLSSSAVKRSVSFAEIIIPSSERGETETKELTTRLSNTIKTRGAFSAAARRYSRSPSARSGGQLRWTPVANLPPVIAGQLLALEVGEVTAPINLGSAIGLFQLRDVRIDGKGEEDIVTTSYVEVPMPAGNDVSKQRNQAADLIADVDTCNDIRAESERFGEEAFNDVTISTADVAADVGMELAKLDPKEASAGLMRGNQVVVVMVCTRSKDLPEGARTQIREAMFQQRMGSFGNGYLEELKSEAIITYAE